ncbi:MAG TPA: hypothetical protein VGF76_10155, partial [Polyangiaceae bacterium]
MFTSTLTKLRLRSLVWCTPLLAWSMPSACSSSDSGSPADASGAAGNAGSHATGGASSAGTNGLAGSGATTDESAGANDLGGEGGSAGFGDLPAQVCIFHTPHASDASSAEAGAAGAAGASGAADVEIATSRAIGPYLTNREGHALYVFGSDVPGDCHVAPVSTCTGAPCTQTWTAFYAGDRQLAAG